VAVAAFLRRHRTKLTASVLITLGIWYTLRRGGLKIVPEGGDFAHVRWWVVGVYVLSLFGFTYFRSVRWRFLLASIATVPKKRLLIVSAIGFAAIFLLPFRLGEVVRPYMVVRAPPDQRPRPGDRPLTLTAAMSSIVAERIIDGLYLSIVLAVALLFVPTVHPLPDHVVGLPITVESVRRGGYLMLFAFCAAFGTIAVFYFARSWAHRMTLATVGKVSMKLAEMLARTFEKFADGLHVFSRGRDAFGFFFETTMYWLFNAIGMWMLAWGCGVVHADGSPPLFGEACAYMGMLGCTIIIPGPPGMLGVFQAGLYAAMTMYYPTEVVTGPGAAFVFLLYATQAVFGFATAGASLLLQGGRAPLAALEPADAE
jgi:hypothetical protein